MPDFRYKIEIETASRLACEAGRIALDLQGNLGEVRYKEAKDIVTEADLAADAHISTGISAAFPGHSIRTEESGEHAGSKDYIWIIDPIDGTVNFSRGMPLWGISIALVHNGIPVAAVCHLPRLSETYTAVRGQGAFLNGKRIHVSNVGNLAHSIVSNGDFNVGKGFDPIALNTENLENFRREAQGCLRVKCVGSAVVEGCFVAAGRLDAYCMTVSFPWDIAGAILMVEEAGGRVSSTSGAPLDLIDGAKVLMTNGILHQAYVNLLQRGAAQPPPA